MRHVQAPPLGAQTAWKLVATPEISRIATALPQTPTDLARLDKCALRQPDAYQHALRFTVLAHPRDGAPALNCEQWRGRGQMGIGGLGIARFSDFMIAMTSRRARLVGLFPARLDGRPHWISQRSNLTRVSGFWRRLASLFGWAGNLSEG